MEKKKKGGNVVRIVMIIQIRKNVQNYISYRKHSLVTFNEAAQILAASLMMVL